MTSSPNSVSKKTVNLEPRPWLVFSSSTGETFRTLWKTLSPEARRAYQGFFSDRSCGAAAVSRQEAPDVPVYELERSNFESKVLELVQRRNFHKQNGIVLLCGFFGILSANFLEKFPAPLVNTHPSLLPSFPGLDRKVHQAVHDSVTVSGFTLHLVTEKLDGGPVLFQHPVWADSAFTADELRNRVRQSEQKWLPFIWEKLLRSDLTAEDRNLKGLELRRRLQLNIQSFDERKEAHTHHVG